MALTLGELLTAEMLSELAGDPTFERGAEYAKHGRVLRLSVVAGCIRATVRGSNDYRVRLWIERSSVRHSCDCPDAENGPICKHAVAVGLYWLNQIEVDEFTMRRDARPGAVRAFLKTLDKTKLVGLLLDHARSDARLQQRLNSLAALKQGHGPDVPALRKLITKAAHVRESMQDHEVNTFARKLDDAVDSIDDLIRDGHAAQAVELAEHAIDRVEHALDVVDDSDGSVARVLHRALELHLAACRDARPDPVALARRLFKWELRSHWDVFCGAAYTYRTVLGDRGLKEYQELATPVWAELSAQAAGDEGLELEPDDRDDLEIDDDFAITSMMEALAMASGNLEDWILVASRSLSSGDEYLRIAEKCREEGNAELATQWAQRGMQLFSGIQGGGLPEFLADVYSEQGKHEQALSVIWAMFQSEPSFRSYALLKSHAERAGIVDEWRERALDHLRGTLANKVPPKTLSSPLEYRSNSTADNLARILISEGLIDEAWRTASRHDCGEQTWLELAGLRETDHPADVIPFYCRLFEQTVNFRGNENYDYAVELLNHIQELSRRAGTEQEFARYLDDVRTTHKAKRNFMQRLEKVRRS